MKSASLALLFVLAVVLVNSDGEARTWRVNTAGTGDAPDLYAAMDSAQALDVVLVEAGEYHLSSQLRVPGSVRLVGESGPGHTLLYRDEYLDLGTISLLAGATISGIYVRGNTQVVLFIHLNGGADHCILESTVGVDVVESEFGGKPTFQNCLFVGGEIGCSADLVRCIIFSDLGNRALYSWVVECDVLGSVDPRIDVSISNGNFSLDPQFCGIPGSGNYFLKSTSPCLPENNPRGPILFGPLGAGCGAVSVQSSTWGAVKGLYRSP